jgi:hypothetical protein
LGASPDLLVLANPENRRLSFFQEAVGRRGWNPARVVPHSDLLAGRTNLRDHVGPGTVVRIESTGENHGVECQILSLGGIPEAGSIPEERGRLLHPSAWFRGFRAYMDSLERDGRMCGAAWFNSPSDIVAMFDKPGFKSLLGDLAPPTLGTFGSFAEFARWAVETGASRVFVKLPASSSASGVAAWRAQRSTGKQVLRTTLEMVDPDGKPRFYNSLLLREYRDPRRIAQVLDFLFSEGAFVEPWIAKPTFGGLAWDLRILGVAGKPAHRIARLSRGPMTNLHLGNRRLDPDELDLPADAWEAVERVVESALRRLPGVLYAGLDVVVPAGSPEAPTRPLVLEANAFGDLLPGLRHEGQDPWDLELAALARRLSCRA